MCNLAIKFDAFDVSVTPRIATIKPNRDVINKYTILDLLFLKMLVLSGPANQGIYTGALTVVHSENDH